MGVGSLGEYFPSHFSPRNALTKDDGYPTLCSDS